MSMIDDHGQVRLCFVDSNEATILAELMFTKEALGFYKDIISSDYFMFRAYYEGSFKGYLGLGGLTKELGYRDIVWLPDYCYGKYNITGIYIKDNNHAYLYWIRNDGVPEIMLLSGFTYFFHPCYVYLNSKILIRRLAVFTRMITEGEWEKIVKSDFDWIPNDAYAFYTFDDYGSDIIKDKSGNGRDVPLGVGRWCLRRPLR